MILNCVSVEMEHTEDSVSIKLPEIDKGLSIGVSSGGDIIVSNKEEERVYHIKETKHGGFRLVEGTLL